MKYISHNLLKFGGLLLICFSLSNCSSIRLNKDVSKDRTERRTKAKTRTAVNANPKTIAKKDPLRMSIIDSAMDYKGIKYVYGGKTPKGFDCSGFTSHVFTENGVTLTGASRHQATQGKSKSLKEAQPGDLIFFKNKGKVVHVSIVVEAEKDNLWVVHSTSSRGVVKDEILNSSYWRPRIAGVRDILHR